MPDTVLQLVSINRVAVSREVEPPTLSLVKAKRNKNRKEKTAALDTLVHRHVYRGFAVEVWREHTTRTPTKPSYYTLRFDTAVKRRFPRGSKLIGFDTVARALSATEFQIDERRKVLDDPRFWHRRTVRERLFRRPDKKPLRNEAALIETISTMTTYSDLEIPPRQSTYSDVDILDFIAPRCVLPAPVLEAYEDWQAGQAEVCG